MVDLVRDHARAGLEGPSVLTHPPVQRRQGDLALQLFQRPEDQGPVRPGAGVGDIEVVAARLGLEPALAGRPRRAVRRDPVAEPALAADKPAAGSGGVVPLVAPDAIDQEPHARRSTRLPPRTATQQMGQARTRVTRSRPALAV